LIVAPHPDDETFGCGGLVSLKRAAGIPVRVVFFTDGEAVASGLGESVAAVVAARRREALNACQRIGVEAENVRWLHLPDGKLPHPGQSSFEEASRTLLAEIEAFVPGEIYCPHLLDVHRDHIAATRITHQAVRLWGQPCAVFYYPVWMWYHASSGLRKKLDVTGAWRVDISTVLTDKEHAMAAYLEAPKTSQGNPYCGRLPRSFLRNFRRNYEVIFSSKANADEILARPVK
jgi:LmbE family N-acetylglucosaminyl deacetylase